jgi:hypothetical protein
MYQQFKEIIPIILITWLLTSGCFSNYKVNDISSLQSNPQNFENKTITIVGTVTGV